jgi:hypothetical protein
MLTLVLLVILLISGAFAQCSNVRVDLQTDGFPRDNAWTLRDRNGRIVAQRGGFTRVGQLEREIVCLADGEYNFQLTDSVGDGLLAHPRGYYEIAIRGQTRLKTMGGAFRTISHTIRVGFNPRLTSRETDWLNSHNIRRRDWHGRFGQAYRPLRWAPSLARDAQSWANTLLQRTTTCHLTASDHARTSQGENMASNVGTGSWGAFPPAEDIVRRFVDREEFLVWPRNSHLTQALWWSTGYLGCADASRTLENGANCHIFVCRYTRPGNCDVGSNTNLQEDPHAYNAMLMDDLRSRCPELVPEEGIF